MNRASRIKWFADMGRTLGVPIDPAFNLMAELKIDSERFQSIQDVVQNYIRACFGHPREINSEQGLLSKLNRELDLLANRSPNGVLLPKQEFQLEFNQIHKVVSSWLQSLKIDGLIYQMFCPITIRLGKGIPNVVADARPYASTKLHVDLWSGDPADNVSIILPIFGDTEQNTVEFYHPPDDFESRFLRILKDYDEAKGLMGHCRQYPIRPRLGYACFFDGTVLHKTVQKEGGVRVSIQLLLRRPIPDQERIKIESACSPGRLKLYIDREEWFTYGTTKFLIFRDTYTDAARGVFLPRPYDEQLFEVSDHL